MIRLGERLVSCFDKQTEELVQEVPLRGITPGSSWPDPSPLPGWGGAGVGLVLQAALKLGDLLGAVGL